MTSRPTDCYIFDESGEVPVASAASGLQAARPMIRAVCLLDFIAFMRGSALAPVDLRSFLLGGVFAKVLMRQGSELLLCRSLSLILILRREVPGSCGALLHDASDQLTPLKCVKSAQPL